MHGEASSVPLELLHGSPALANRGSQGPERAANAGRRLPDRCTRACIHASNCRFHAGPVPHKVQDHVADLQQYEGARTTSLFRKGLKLSEVGPAPLRLGSYTPFHCTAEVLAVNTHATRLVTLAAPEASPPAVPYTTLRRRCNADSCLQAGDAAQLLPLFTMLQDLAWDCLHTGYWKDVPTVGRLLKRPAV